MEDIVNCLLPEKKALEKAKEKIVLETEHKRWRQDAYLSMQNDADKKKPNRVLEGPKEIEPLTTTVASSGNPLVLPPEEYHLELNHLKELLRVRELELAPKREIEIQLAQKLKARAAIIRAQHQEELALAELNNHPATRWFKFFEQSKLSIQKTEEICEKSIEDEGSVELPINWDDPEDPVATSLIRQEVFSQKEQRECQAKTIKFTTSLADLKLEDQSLDVFERMWTPISDNNPVFRAYRALLKNLKEKSESTNKQLSACQKCFTVFRLKFPVADHHLHIPSSAFKTAVNSKVVDRTNEEISGLSNEESTRQCFQKNALVALAIEAGAYKMENGVEYIKMLRVSEGKRHRDGHVEYDRREICGNSDITEAHEEVANTKFRIAGFAKGLLAVIVDIFFVKKGVPKQFIYPLLHGAGLEDLFRYYRYLVPEFRSELIFRGFLIAFGNHVRSTLDLDSSSYPVTHWWRGAPQMKGQKMFFIDSSRSNARSEFDVKGRAILAHNLAERTFKVLEIFFTTQKYSEYLTKYISSSKLIEGKDKDVCIDDSLLNDASTHDGCESISEFKQKELLDIDEIEIMRRVKISKTMLAKRNPKLREDEDIDLPYWFPQEEQKAMTPAEWHQKRLTDPKRFAHKRSQDAEAKALKRSSMTDEERLLEKEKKNARMSKLRAERKVQEQIQQQQNENRLP
jgi:hypothetical protein